ncbi:MAG: AEC family transporter [Bacilli bacterium]|jgi:predicted permease|nr:AEC family transporter [Bacilli bacterium]
MQDTLILLNRLASIVCFVILGIFIMKRNILTDKGKEIITILLNRIALPAMIIAAYVKIELTKDVIFNVLIVIVGALLVYLLNYIFALISASYHRLTDESKSIYLNGALHSNTAFLAFPLLEAVFGTQGLFYATIYYMIDNILFTTVGMRRFTTINGFKFPPVTIALIIAIVLMIIFNLIGFNCVTTFPYLVCHDLGQMTTPLAFIFMGMLIYEYNLKDVLSNHLAHILVGVKMVIIPLIMAMILLIFKQRLEATLAIVILVQSCMPSLSVLISMSYEYKQDTKLASSLVVVGHVFSIVSIPILFFIFNLLFK